METKRQKRERPFQFLLTPDLMAQLEQLSIESGESKGSIIRKLIQHAFAMRFQAHPICASGRPCLVPHLHVGQSAPIPGGNIG